MQVKLLFTSHIKHLFQESTETAQSAVISSPIVAASICWSPQDEEGQKSITNHSDTNRTVIQSLADLRAI